MVDSRLRKTAFLNLRSTVVSLLLFALGISLGSPARAEQLIQLRNGVILRGFVVEIASLNQNPFALGGAGDVQIRPIWMVDDGLRRVYIHKLGMVAGPPADVADLQQTIPIWQHLPAGGKDIQALGAPLAVSAFSDYGRRTITVRDENGNPINIFQGITEINARYAKLEGLRSTPSFNWDMRMATSAIDSPTLLKIFNRCLDMTDIDERFKVVRFFNECERYGDAKAVLKETIRMFPQEQRLEAQVASITERQANQLLEEAKLRAAAGQPVLAQRIAEQFPLTDVGRLTRLEVQDLLTQQQSTQQQITELIKSLRQLVSQLDPARQEQLAAILDEIDAGLSSHTLARLSDFSRLGQADEVALESRIALAVCGWLLGSGSGEQNLVIAISLLKVREKVREYLACRDAVRREAILRELRDLEGAEPEYVDRMLKLLTPQLPFPEESGDEIVPGLYRVRETESLASNVDYVIQLPPEYDPLRPYPCVVALAPPGAAPESQIEWWSGPYDESMKTRMGLGSRHGFIVVAPNWTRAGQSLYEYTPREHSMVLASLRDAMRRAQIDSDRVFLAGHGEGGTAAWDIALSHPELWAGMISVSGEPRKTILHYDDNAKYVPLYLLMGEKDGAPTPLIRNGPIMDDYMGMGYDAMVIMYRGRGREFFYEDLPNIFEWMQTSAHVRAPIPTTIEAETMRRDDRFFWWLELADVKDPVAINPILWDQAERLRAAKISASVGADNQIRIGQGPTDAFTVWLRPDMGVDMSKRITIRYRTRRVDLDFDGDLATILEDARTRADRKRPFWAKVAIP